MSASQIVGRGVSKTSLLWINRTASVFPSVAQSLQNSILELGKG